MAASSGAYLGWDSMLTRALMVAGVLVLLLLLFKTALYFSPAFARWYVRRQTQRLLRRLPHRHVHWLLYQDRLETKSAAATRTFAWSHLRRVHEFPGFWQLHWQSGEQLLVPTTALTPEVQTQIRNHVARG